MAIYQPPKPKQSSLGGILQATGEGMTTVGSGLAIAGLPAGGIGAVPGLIVAGVGAIAKTAGTIISGNQDARNKENEAQYAKQYANRVQGEKNLNISAEGINNQNAANYNQMGINSSVKAINNYITPPAGGTGIVNQRLV